MSPNEPHKHTSNPRRRIQRKGADEAVPACLARIRDISMAAGLTVMIVAVLMIMVARSGFAWLAIVDPDD